MIRSIVFTALLDLSPEFCRMESRAGSEVVTQIADAWHKDTSNTDLFAFVKAWLLTHPITEGGDA